MGLVVYFFTNASWPSQHPAIYIWSWSRLVFLVALLLTSAYFLFSLFRPRLQKLNNDVCCLALTVGLGVETFLRLMPEAIPAGLLSYFPQQVAEKKAQARGHIMTGEGMIYHYAPENRELKNWPSLHLDECGYRNPSQKSEHFDVVLLGDSIVFALAAEKDLGQLFREAGSSCLNLAMGGYAPQHYRDAYQRYVIEKNIRHDVVLTFLFIGNDFSDAMRYEKVRRHHGDYRDYIYDSANYMACLPWVINMARALPPHINSLMGGGLNGGVVATGRSLRLPYKTIEVGEFLWWPPELHENSAEWECVRAALGGIIALAKTAGAHPVFFLVPSPATIYSQFEPDFRVYDQRHAVTAALLEGYCA